MISELQTKKKTLVQEVWGDICLECNSKNYPQINCYTLENEEVIVLSCSKCNFTIVIVEISDNYELNSLEKANLPILMTSQSDL